MSNNVGDLIARLKQAESRLAAMINQPMQPSHAELLHLDRQLSEAFEALISATVHDAEELQQRILFLISHIRKLADHSTLTDRILDRIEEDVAAIAGLSGIAD